MYPARAAFLHEVKGGFSYGQRRRKDSENRKGSVLVGGSLSGEHAPRLAQTIDDLLQLPYAYCEHTADKDSRSEHKDHVHIIVAKSNTTSYKHIMEVFNLLSAPGKKALNTCEACVNIRHCYDYLIHDTDSCRKQGKEQYDPSCRITGNNFDIGAYEQISSAQKQEMLKELVGYIIANGFTTINDFTVAAMNDFDGSYWKSSSATTEPSSGTVAATT